MGGGGHTEGRKSWVGRGGGNGKEKKNQVTPGLNHRLSA